jgi:hypothetical protein
MAFHNALTDGQADASTRISALGMESLEGLKDALGILCFEPNAVVLHGEDPGMGLPTGRKMDAGRICPAKLERVTEQILEDQP